MAVCTFTAVLIPPISASDLLVIQAINFNFHFGQTTTARIPYIDSDTGMSIPTKGSCNANLKSFPDGSGVQVCKRSLRTSAVS